MEWRTTKRKEEQLVEGEADGGWRVTWRSRCGEVDGAVAGRGGEGWSGGGGGG